MFEARGRVIYRRRLLVLVLAAVAVAAGTGAARVGGHAAAAPGHCKRRTQFRELIR